ncbi:hypothetical protein EHM69_04220 [candidate division KSB1 bacterium]|nr:MAG: hypothetical protein EHM69_04220 [candidate division KSB1 bacterium]
MNMTFKEKVQMVSAHYFEPYSIEKMLNSIPFYVRSAKLFFMQVAPAGDSLKLEIGAQVRGLLIDITYDGKEIVQTVLPLLSITKIQFRHTENSAILTVASDEKGGVVYRASGEIGCKELLTYYRGILSSYPRGDSHVN